MPRPTCYMCDALKTSREHAPPQCLFPEQKDTPDGVDFRKNLITVPSCDKHNSVKSHNDEYLLQVLAASYTSSSIGLDHFITKVQRAFLQAPSKGSSFIRQSAPVLLKREHEPEWEHGLEVIVEAERLDAVLSNCARALYFEETATKFLGPVHVKTGFTMYNDAAIQAQVTAGLLATESFFANQPAKGENQTIFWYKFAEGENSAFFLMSFYSYSKVLVKFSKNEQAPHGGELKN